MITAQHVLTYACTLIYANHTKNVEQVQRLNEWGCRDGMHYAKNHGNKEIPLAILPRVLAQSCVIPPYTIRQKVMHDCTSILDSIANLVSTRPTVIVYPEGALLDKEGIQASVVGICIVLHTCTTRVVVKLPLASTVRVCN